MPSNRVRRLAGDADVVGRATAEEGPHWARSVRWFSMWPKGESVGNGQALQT